MDAFSSSPLTDSFPPGIRFNSPSLSPAPSSPTRTELDFPTDVDQSFNSSMSISVTDSPPAPSPSGHLGKAATSSAMFSPTPSFTLKPLRKPELGATASLPLLYGKADNEPMMASRPLASNRMFGRELSLNARPQSAQSLGIKGKGKMLPPCLPEGKPAMVSPVRMKHTMSHEDMGSPQFVLPRMGRRESAPTLESPRVRSSLNGSTFELSDIMDVDSPRRPVRSSTPRASPPTFGSPGLGSFFCESPAAPAMPLPKRRTLAASSPSSPSSSPSSGRASGMLFGNAGKNARRSNPYKRPSLNPLNPNAPQVAESRKSTHMASAFPILYGPPKAASMLSGVPQMRRALSVCDQPQMPTEGSDTESDFDASPSVNATHAEYQRRYGRVAARIDGSPGFKGVRSSLAAVAAAARDGTGPAPRPGPAPKDVLPSPYGAGGLPGFGDNEVDGKILPCHRVKEDGLVRITPKTMQDLLAGKYDSCMKRYHVLDCRFDYEYDGGHIAGAVNVRSLEQLDELLLQVASGLNADEKELPAPSRSGQCDSNQQVVIVFHCEFSAKRAPTFAKHLRSRDRMLNNSIYPKIFYPELYILEGGYCGFYQICPTHCEPQSYVPMDDPRHFERRNSDLHDFRKFSRTRSFTYGELQTAPQSRCLAPCAPLVFAAGNAAASRRGAGQALIEEEQEADSSFEGGSPCPRVVSMGHAPAGYRAATNGRTIGRVVSYADAMIRR